MDQHRLMYSMLFADPMLDGYSANEEPSCSYEILQPLSEFYEADYVYNREVNATMLTRELYDVQEIAKKATCEDRTAMKDEDLTYDNAKVNGSVQRKPMKEKEKRQRAVNKSRKRKSSLLNALKNELKKLESCVEVKSNLDDIYEKARLTYDIEFAVAC